MPATSLQVLPCSSQTMYHLFNSISTMLLPSAKTLRAEGKCHRVATNESKSSFLVLHIVEVIYRAKEEYSCQNDVGRSHKNIDVVLRRSF